MESFISRQPVFNREIEVFGYELSSRPLAFSSQEIDLLRASRPCFLRFPITSMMAGILPPRDTVILIPAGAGALEELPDLCRRLHERGYQIALDEFRDTEKPNPLMKWTNYLKVDCRSTGRRDQEVLFWKYGVKASLIAGNLARRDEFDQAASVGFQYFQGEFFAEPVKSAAGPLAPRKMALLRILEHLWQPDLSLRHLTELLQCEPQLASELFRHSSQAARRQMVSGIPGKTAAHVGEEGLLRWLTVLAVAELGADRPAELLASALVRARLGESLAVQVEAPEWAAELFLVGILSHMDVMCGQPLADLLRNMEPSRAARKLLLRQAPAFDPLERLWSEVRAYQSGRFDKLSDLPRSTAAAFPAMYRGAVAWADDILRQR